MYNLFSRLALDFRTFLENMKMSSSLSKIFETGINVFKSNSQIILLYTGYARVVNNTIMNLVNKPRYSKPSKGGPFFTNYCKCFLIKVL